MKQAGRTFGQWLEDVEARLRRVERFMYAMGGGFAVLEFLRACHVG
jgi:hypothetical protein